jgi:hypothetical protein
MVGLMSLTFLPLIPPALGEGNLVDRNDDALIILLAIAGIVWYLSRRNRYHHSFAPLALVIVSFIAQTGGMLLEIGDPSQALQYDFMRRAISCSECHWCHSNKTLGPAVVHYKGEEKTLCWYSYPEVRWFDEPSVELIEEYARLHAQLA